MAIALTLPDMLSCRNGKHALRKAQLWEVLKHLLALGDVEGKSEKQLKADRGRIREKISQRVIAP